ncbi:hypothetical protein [Pseudoduganella sp. GCM10020061]|uniref:hypothetical protein n=1 Tax=Pseudoduganella sp. GCM10020061 TaxID=3317345 RepID=UPI003626DF5E
MLIIALLSELIVLHVVYSMVYSYSDIKSIVDAFAFGGTLVGLLVGVIAIIYAFYQGAAQQRTNETMIVEICKLGAVKDEIATAASTLAEQLRHIDTLKEHVARIDSNVSNSLDDIRNQLKTTPATALFDATSVETTTNGTNVDLLLDFVSVRRPFYLCFDAYALKDTPDALDMAGHAKRMFEVLQGSVAIFKDEPFETHETMFVAVLNTVVSFYRAARILTPKFATDGSDIVHWTLVPERLDDIGKLRSRIMNCVDPIFASGAKSLLDRP